MGCTRRLCSSWCCWLYSGPLGTFVSFVVSARIQIWRWSSETVLFADLPDVFCSFLVFSCSQPLFLVSDPSLFALCFFWLLLLFGLLEWHCTTWKAQEVAQCEHLRKPWKAVKAFARVLFWVSSLWPLKGSRSGRCLYLVAWPCRAGWWHWMLIRPDVLAPGQFYSKRFTTIWQLSGQFRRNLRLYKL